MHEINRLVQEGDNWHQRRFDMPHLFKLYNKGMGGTDSIDQRMSYYRPKVKTVKWAPRIFTHIINAAGVNSYIIMKDHQGLGERFKHLDFLQQLVVQLAHEFLQGKRIVCAEVVPHPVQRLATWNRDPSRLIGTHFPCTIPNDQILRAFDGNRTFIRGYCMLCGLKIISRCRSCNISLCIDISDDNPTSCFEKFHTLTSITNIDRRGQIADV
jgi:hypothetical protein